MKKTTIILFYLLIILFATDCKKKRYPSDIPMWLKEKINNMERESPRNGCVYGGCRVVTEHTDGSSTFYKIQMTGAPSGYFIYNYPGSLICTYESVDMTECFFNYDKLEKTRIIWVED